MDISKKINIFRKGILILGAIAILVFGLNIMKENISVSLVSGKKSLPIYSVGTDEAKVSLTFDSAWDVTDLPEILDILDRQNVKATFFVTGDFVSRCPEAVKELVERGHELGNHGDNHKHMTNLSEEENINEIQGCNTKVKALTNKEMILFRAPYGDYNSELVDVGFGLGMYVIQWDVDTLDVKRKNRVNVFFLFNVYK